MQRRPAGQGQGAGLRLPALRHARPGTIEQIAADAAVDPKTRRAAPTASSCAPTAPSSAQRARPVKRRARHGGRRRPDGRRAHHPVLPHRPHLPARRGGVPRGLIARKPRLGARCSRTAVHSRPHGSGQGRGSSHARRCSQQAAGNATAQASARNVRSRAASTLARRIAARSPGNTCTGMQGGRAAAARPPDARGRPAWSAWRRPGRRCRSTATARSTPARAQRALGHGAGAPPR